MLLIALCTTISLCAAFTAGIWLYRRKMYRLIEANEKQVRRNPETGRLIGAEPFFHQGGKQGILLIHGFGGATREVSFLGAHLASLGYTVLGVALPGQAVNAYETEKYGWDDYLAAARRGLQELRGKCDQVAVAGLSMGAALSLALAEKEKELSAVVAMNPFIYIRYSWYHLLPSELWIKLLGRAIRFTYKSQLGRANDTEMLREHVASRFLSMRALLSVLKALSGLRRGLPSIKQPLLILQSRHDGTVSQHGARLVQSRASSAIKQLEYFENSNHLLTLDHEKEQVFARVGEFLKEHF
jgi:carboxylesterase